MPTNNNQARAAAQLRTLAAQPDRWGTEWTNADLEMVKAFDDVSAEELALALKRTEYSILAVRQALRDGRPVGNGGRVRAGRQDQGWSPDDPRWG